MFFLVWSLPKPLTATTLAETWLGTIVRLSISMASGGRKLAVAVEARAAVATTSVVKCMAIIVRCFGSVDGVFVVLVVADAVVLLSLLMKVELLIELQLIVVTSGRASGLCRASAEVEIM